MLGCFILVQLALVSLKFDNLIQITWNQVLLLLFPISIISISAFSFLVIYSSILKCKYPQTYYANKFSLMFLIVGFMGICALLGLILSQVYFKISIQVSSIITTCIFSMVTIYLFIFKKEIVINFCRHK